MRRGSVALAVLLLGCGGKASSVGTNGSGEGTGGRTSGSGGAATTASPASGGTHSGAGGSTASAGANAAGGANAMAGANATGAGGSSVAGTSGTGSSGHRDAGLDTGGAPVADGGTPTTVAIDPTLPAATDCPAMSKSGTYQFGRLSVEIHIATDAKTKAGGPLIVYFHGTASSPAEMQRGLGQSAIDEVVARGGVVAAPIAAACDTCTTTSTNVWFVEDDDVVDDVVACSMKQANIDPRHVHLLGFGSGALHAMHLAIARSNYVASVISHSGGFVKWAFDEVPQDPTNHVASILTYSDDTENIISSYALSQDWYETWGTKGYYTMMCKAGSRNIDTNIVLLTLRFFDEHPYKVLPEPYATGVPAGFPTYCKNTP